jgi:glycosyltransferase involved in cell wall biosynthesis
MSVYNGERYLAEAVDSIVHQTFRDFEFIIVDDGSTDSTAEVLARYAAADSRIVLHRQPNQGVIRALNTGFALARGWYLARMDADDVAAPERFERQVEYLEQHSKVAVLGSSINIIDAAGAVVSTTKFPTHDAGIRDWLFERHQVPFSHPALMFRAEALRCANGFRRAYLHAEDFDLVVRIAEQWQIANLAEPFLHMRRHAGSISVKNIRQQVISILCAWAAAAIRRRGETDPTDTSAIVNRELMRSLDVSDATYEASLMNVYLYWIDVMLQGSDKPAAVRIMREALESEPWEHINRSLIANNWLAAARIYSEQGDRLQSLYCAARAVATRPVIAGRPIKRLVSHMGFAS